MREDTSNDILLEYFEMKREQLVREAEKLGLSHPDILKLSQELDLIHCQIQK
ncbi:aspartyl-phosphate phosphatase Spo0E family protein [Paenibacillus sp. FSL P4-0288]|uniref:aspartyl-phosphate phosphatase Spo0E family protein n=1 Tax=Paenibacillus sp. FSL P4-0288 TaxID=2921633 RepID=UPI0030F78B53